MALAMIEAMTEATFFGGQAPQELVAEEHPSRHSGEQAFDPTKKLLQVGVSGNARARI
jgi:hypothetical protein